MVDKHPDHPPVRLGRATWTIAFSNRTMPTPRMNNHAKRGMAGGVITLGRAKGMTMLEVACRRCERRGRLRIGRLIAEAWHWRAPDCPRMQDPSVSLYERCGVHSPELPKFAVGGLSTRDEKPGSTLEGLPGLLSRNHQVEV